MNEGDTLWKEIYNSMDIAQGTNGDIYIGVVGLSGPEKSRFQKVM